MKKLISYLLLLPFVASTFCSISIAWRYDDLLKDSVSTWEKELPQGKQLIDFLENPDTLTDGATWGEWIRNVLVSIGVDILIPVFVFSWIIMAIIWFYKLMISESSEETSKSWSFIAYGILGTMIMVSAWYITSLLIWSDWSGWAIFSFSELTELDWPDLAIQLYQNLIFPFVKLFLSVVMGILFIVVLVSALRMIFGNTEDEWKKAFNTFIYWIIGVLVIAMSKTIVELVYGSYEDVTWPIEDKNLGSIWLLFDGTWADGESFKVIRSILNWILSLAVFIVVVIIIYLWFIMLFRPDDEEAPKKVKTYIIYAIVWIFIIGSSYLLSRMLIIT